MRLSASFAGTTAVAALSVVPPVEPPAAPSNLVVRKAVQTGVTLEWMDNAASELGFEIERRSAGETFRRIWAVGTDVTSFSDGTLDPGTYYTYRVRAINGAGASAYSNEAGALTLPVSVTFVTFRPSAVTGGETATGTITLSGPAPAGGAIVALGTDSSAAAMPRSVTVPPGATWTTFPVTTTRVAAATLITIAAGYGGMSVAGTLAVLPSGAGGAAVRAARPEVASGRIAVFRRSTREWFLRREDGSATIVAFGGPEDEPVAADYVGAGTAQIAVFRPSTQEWFIRTEDGVLYAQFGETGDVPVPGDYFRLGRAQIAVYRPATQQWFIRRDDGSAAEAQFGGPGDAPVPGDYLGLGRVQIAVFRPATAEWFIRRDDGSAATAQWGAVGDVPVAGDYFGLGRAQIAVYRPGTAEFFLRDDHGEATRVQFGTSGDVAVPFDYLGLGRAQIAVYQPGSGDWFVRADSGAAIHVPWGGPEDRPVRGAFGAGVGLLSVDPR